MDCSTPGFPVLHYLLEPVQTYVHWVGDDIQPPHKPCVLEVKSKELADGLRAGRTGGQEETRVNYNV